MIITVGWPSKAVAKTALRSALKRQSAVLCSLLFAIICFGHTLTLRAASFATVIEDVQPKIVKIYGAGGVRGLEAYQSGFLVSADGYVLTVWSYVLDTEFITITLDDGRKFQAEYVGHDPRVEVALLKIDAEELPHFNIDEAVTMSSGDRVLAFSNLYGVAQGNEPSSVLHGRVSSATKLAARRGAFETTYKGPVYVLDAMTNNPGAAGGALTNRRGHLAGILGKELRNSLNNTWLNYAIPIGELAQSVDDIRSGKIIARPPDDDRRRPLDPMSLSLLGVTLIPDVLDKTPPFVDKIRTDSPAEKAGLRVDDLILFLGDRIVSSCKTLVEELGYIDRGDELRLIVERDKELVEIVVVVPD